MKQTSRTNHNIFNTGKGFTLAEILVVLGVMAVMLVLLTEIFFSSIRGGNKTQAISSLNENGRAIMDMMDKSVRNADAVLCPAFSSVTDTTATSDVLVTLKSGIYTRFIFVRPKDGENGSIERDNPSLESGEEAENPNIFINEVCNVADVQAKNAIAITDTNKRSGASVVDGSFTRTRADGFKDSVNINFDLQPGTQSPQRIPGRIETVNFSTTIEVR